MAAERNTKGAVVVIPELADAEVLFKPNVDCMDDAGSVG